MSKKISFRQLDGILLLDKPSGLSSNQALQQARHLFRAAKGGHTGSLDPLATGLLPLCFGEATKIAGLLLGARKAYETTAVLGLTTDSDDADGAPLLERPVPDFDDATLEAALAGLRGPLHQRAPIYSALKQGGEPLYARARRGESIEAPVRDVVVHRFELLERDGLALRLHVECGSGTYVRSLVRDLGETLGCGAHVATLRRLWIEPFNKPRMFTLDELKERAGEGEAALDACLLPLETGLVGFPEATLDADGCRRIGHGQPARPVTEVPAAASGSPVAIFDSARRCLGIGRLGDDGQVEPQRLFRWAVAGS
ncbi:tRNA pseudouridine(55) synthase TruB [Marilutibacter alkalisoli]|uniref:tRNA pseudouridine synthase B n=1 Tax=Marilutibacter alkalisoli TaxID=2591633 RepID=A0A514BR19_9GAMM|nr:tRNA pseudouridine(55) synthase TruB [Lysobacter alkalisoli]QDH69844.1 tRNA pseudouridine(55) synthase TruB [Lysobacter alkalisoli]